MKTPLAPDNRYLLGIWLKELRLEKHLTQVQLAELTGLSSWTISKIEAGKWNFTVEKMVTILTALGYKIKFTKIKTKRHA